MAKTTDVKLEVTPLPGVTVIGLSLNFTAGAIPTCIVDVAPDEKDVIQIDGSAKGILANPDQEKRKNDITVKLEVKSKSSQGEATKKLEWVGLLDGITVGNTVGQNTYRAVLKGKAQRLLELTVATPGLHPTSINPYRNPFYSVVGNANAGDEQSEVAWMNSVWTEGLNLNDNPIKFYTNLMGHLIDIQKNLYSLYLGLETTTDMTKPLEKIFQDPRYQENLTKAKKLWDKIDTSFVDNGSINQLKASAPNASSHLKNFFLSGPNVFLENYMNFLKFMGCTMIFGGDEKMWVVPERSFIEQKHKRPGLKEFSKEINQANPADYNSYIYSDNGYKDIFAVLVGSEIPMGGTEVVSFSLERGYIGWYVDEKKLTQATGVLIIKNHPFSPFYSMNENNFADAKEMKNKADSPETFYGQRRSYGSNKQEEDQKERNKEKKEKYKEGLGTDILNNYAETKFYQARYGDRQGSITLEFNPKWCPGTSGTLFVRETSFYLDFWVESVTHRIDISPPAGGSAITIISFSCGRMGTTPIGVDEDKFLGYNQGKEKGAREAFVQDIKGQN